MLCFLNINDIFSNTKLYNHVPEIGCKFRYENKRHTSLLVLYYWYSKSIQIFPVSVIKLSRHFYES